VICIYSSSRTWLHSIQGKRCSQWDEQSVRASTVYSRRPSRHSSGCSRVRSSITSGARITLMTATTCQNTRLLSVSISRFSRPGRRRQVECPRPEDNGSLQAGI
jgi:hypothetical protein